MKGKESKNNLVVMKDPEFQKNLLNLESAWLDLKEEIYLFREGTSPQKFYNSSEEYFDLSNDLVFSAQNHSESKMEKILFLRILLIVSSGLILVLSTYQLISMLHLRKRNNRLTNLAYIDPDTKLPNRAYCSKVITDYQKMDTLPKMVCVYFDLNNLKKTNDTLGHEAGDKLIAAFGRILKETSKSYGFMSRNGGDEFVGFF